MKSIYLVPVLAAVAALVAAPACGGSSALHGSGPADGGTAQPSAEGSTLDDGATGSGSSGSESGGDADSSSGSGGSSGGVADSGGGSDSGGAVGRDSGDGADSGGSGGGGGTCAGDTTLPAEPTIPPACTTLQATQAATAGKIVPSEGSLDTSRIQAALNACGSGRSVRLTASGADNAFVSGPLSLPSGVTLWVDTGATLFASRNPSLYGSGCGTSNGTCAALITCKSANAGIMGLGVIDGQGGELMVGQTQSWWDLSESLDGSNGSAANPALVQTTGATNFTMYEITLNNSPKFHVKVDATGFIIWGITIKTPSTSTNSHGTALSASKARNTDGVDPGETAINGYIVCSNISDGDDQIAIKGGTKVDHLTIAHDHFGAGHGMSIGSETNGGVTDVSVYDLSIDGTNSGMSGGSSNGIRIKSDASVGGLVSNVTYSDVCVRELSNPIVLTPHYTTASGSLIPQYTGITIKDFHSLSSSVTPSVTLDGYDSSHLLGITLDNVAIDGMSSSNVSSSYASVTLGPGAVSFKPAGTDVTVTDDASGSTTVNPCTNKWVTF
jgi:polygalacturonase